MSTFGQSSTHLKALISRQTFTILTSCRWGSLWSVHLGRNQKDWFYKIKGKSCENVRDQTDDDDDGSGNDESKVKVATMIDEN